MNEEDAPAPPPEQRGYSDAKPLRLSSSPPMWNDRARGMNSSGSSLAPKAPYYISGAILLVAIVIVAFAFFGKGDDKAKQPTIVAQPTAVAQPDGQPVVAAPAGPAGNPVEAVSAAVMRTLAKPLIEDCTKADPGRDAGKLCATARGE